VFLAKEGHEGMVGINLLEKIQLPHMFALYGAMLAGVDCVLMGAGIPIQIPLILDKLARHEQVSYRLSVIGALSSDDYHVTFDPATLVDTPAQTQLYRPDFFPIVSSHSLAKILLSKASSTINGFIVEFPTAGGHNAPPRGKMQTNERGEPVYTERDQVEWEEFRKLNVPFWIAGAQGSNTKLQEARRLGATGIQTGSIFALCEESGMQDEYKRDLRRMAFRGEIDVFTDPRASPSGFPFKVVNLPGSVAEEATYAVRPRMCDIGRLSDMYRKENGNIGFRCAGESVEAYVAKGGKIEDTHGRKCLCNGLTATAGFPQRQPHGYLEAPIATLGDDVSFVHSLMKHETDTYTAADVLRYLHGG
jgi:NAD(P)H-dependent flavin oxidoreductase YrpB (nitropropane dioxygenase family)